MSAAERIQLVFAIATLPVSLAFIWLYSSDRWARHWFGRSLMMIAVAVLLSCIATIAFRLFGEDYWGREVLIVATWILTFAAMLIRTFVLWDAKRSDRQRETARH